MIYYSTKINKALPCLRQNCVGYGPHGVVGYTTIIMSAVEYTAYFLGPYIW